MSIVQERVEFAAKLFGVEPEEVLGPGRFRNVVNARRLAMTELRLAGWHPQQIGAAFGRDRSSVISLTRGTTLPPSARDRRPKPADLPPPPRVSGKATPEQAAERSQRQYEREHRQNAIEGSRALLERQVRFNQFPCRVGT